jgi:hypothetical protein
MNGHILLKAFCFERVIIKYIKCACFWYTSNPYSKWVLTFIASVIPKLYVENYTVFCICHLDHSIESVQPWSFAVCLLQKHCFYGEIYMTVCVISGLRCEVDENCTLLCYYTASSGNFLPTFREMLARYYHHLQHNNPEEFSSLLIWPFVQPEVVRLPLVDCL